MPRATPRTPWQPASPMVSARDVVLRAARPSCSTSRARGRGPRVNVAQLRGMAKGAATLVPPVNRMLSVRTGEGTSSARYCYTVFLRQLVRTRQVHDFGRPVPESVAELGPGNSIGVGLAALLAGAERYSALDAVAHA